MPNTSANVKANAKANAKVNANAKANANANANANAQPIATRKTHYIPSVTMRSVLTIRPETAFAAA